MRAGRRQIKCSVPRRAISTMSEPAGNGRSNSASGFVRLSHASQCVGGNTTTWRSWMGFTSALGSVVSSVKLGGWLPSPSRQSGAIGWMVLRRREEKVDLDNVLCEAVTQKRIDADARDQRPNRPSVRRRRDVARRIRRRRRRIRGLTDGRADHGANRDAGGDATPARSVVVISVATVTVAIDVNVPVGRDVRVPAGDVRASVRAGVRASVAAGVHGVPVEVVALEVAAACSTGRALLALAAATTTRAVLHEDQSGVARPERVSVGARIAVRRERDGWQGCSAAREREHGCQQ